MFLISTFAIVPAPTQPLTVCNPIGVDYIAWSSPVCDQSTQ